MPKRKVDFSKSVVYSISNVNTNECLYIGSTTNFISRKSFHRTSPFQIKCRYYNIPIYIKIRELGVDYITIYPVENISCNNKNELLIREKYWIDYYKPSCNCRSPIIEEDEIKKCHSLATKKWRDKNKTEWNKYNREYREKNRDAYNKYSRDLRKWNVIKKTFLNILLV